MDSGMIGKREKAKRYAEEPTRFQFNRFNMTFRGDNNDHEVGFADGKFQCDCEFFMTNRDEAALRSSGGPFVSRHALAGRHKLFKILRTVQYCRPGRIFVLCVVEEYPDQGAGRRVKQCGGDEQRAKAVLLLDDAGDERAHCPAHVP